MTDKPKSVFVLGEGGSVFELDLPLHDAIVEKMVKGYIRRVKNAKGDPYTGSNPIPGVSDAADADESEAPADRQRPALSASKAEWVGFAVFESERLGEPITPDQADALTKDDLIAKYGTTPAPAGN